MKAEEDGKGEGKTHGDFSLSPPGERKGHSSDAEEGGGERALETVVRIAEVISSREV